MKRVVGIWRGREVKWLVRVTKDVKEGEKPYAVRVEGGKIFATDGRRMHVLVEHEMRLEDGWYEVRERSGGRVAFLREPKTDSCGTHQTFPVHYKGVRYDKAPEKVKSNYCQGVVKAKMQGEDEVNLAAIQEILCSERKENLQVGYLRDLVCKGGMMEFEVFLSRPTYPVCFVEKSGRRIAWIMGVRPNAEWFEVADVPEEIKKLEVAG